MKIVLTIGDKDYTLTKLSPNSYKKFRDMLKEVGDMDLFGNNNYTDKALDRVATVLSTLFEKDGLTVEIINNEADISDLVAFVREVQILIEKGAADRIGKMYEDFFQESANALAQKISSTS